MVRAMFLIGLVLGAMIAMPVRAIAELPELCPCGCGMRLDSCNMAQCEAKEPVFCSTDSTVGAGAVDGVGVKTNDAGETVVVTITAAVNRSLLWKPGHTLTILFLDGTDDHELIKRVEENARKWEKVTNLRFVFFNSLDDMKAANVKQADVRITFRGIGYNSMVGTSSLTRGQSEHSMQLGGLSSRTDPKWLQRSVLHEFGHAIGFQHEHQNPRGGIKWKQPDALNYFKETTGWSEEKIRSNIFDRLSSVETESSRFDPKSIMLYSFPGKITTDGHGFRWNDALSKTDKMWAAGIYPDSVADDLGVSVRTAPGTMSIESVIVTKVTPGSPATHLRQPGDQIAWSLSPGVRFVSINNNPVGSVDDFDKAMSNVGKRVQMEVEGHDGRLHSFTAKMPD